jgi:hypothetical protein
MHFEVTRRQPVPSEHSLGATDNTLEEPHLGSPRRIDTQQHANRYHHHTSHHHNTRHTIQPDVDVLC